jgi:Cu2+-exporting ATPase
MADRVAGRFIVALLVLAVATAVAWWWIDPGRALWIFVAVLVVSCPCALSLATPAALTVATGALAARGVLVTRGHAIEALARADRFVFDKTGTLTVGHGTGRDDSRTRRCAFALAIAAALERGSEHPIARALIGGGADADSWRICRACHYRGGCRRESSTAAWRLGRPEFVGAMHHGHAGSAIESKVGAGDTVIALGNEEGWQAFFRLSDGLRPEAAAMSTGLCRRRHQAVDFQR